MFYKRNKTYKKMLVRQIGNLTYWCVNCGSTLYYALILKLLSMCQTTQFVVMPFDFVNKKKPVALAN